MQLLADSLQSTLHPAGRGAAEIAELLVWMAGGGALIWLLVVGLAVYAIRSPSAHAPKWTKRLVIGGGALLPTVVLTVLLAYGLSLLPELERPAPEGSLQIDVAGVRWWWRVRYHRADGSVVETANQIRVPANHSVDFHLSTEDVIHSFWIPSLGGKVDMMPGRVNDLKLHPTRVGFYRGVCAEYCGGAHAQMNFDVLVLSEQDFSEWLDREAEPADDPQGTVARLGQQVFFRQGCSACHTIRGTSANGTVGPDLTHLGSRPSIGAGLLKNTPANLKKWIVDTHRVKPSVQMPPFRSLANDDSAAELTALATYLGQLR